ncbi:MAG TPA: hypothetical protein VHC21_00810 [Candidatus Saccharimonadales bacterium]|nr:hypothetical protein [Candidatus Saccharimonadales bacterium]
MNKEKTTGPDPSEAETALHDSRLASAVKTERERREEEKRTQKIGSTIGETKKSREITRLDQLFRAAKIVAAEMNTRADQQSEEPPQGEQEIDFSPDLVVERPWVERRKKLIKKFDRTPKVKLKGDILHPGEKRKGSHEEVLAEGWLLARGAKVSGKKQIVQELMLGTDGKLHVYVPEGDYDVSAIINSPASRSVVQSATNIRSQMPLGGLSRVVRDVHGSEGYHGANTDPSTDKFISLEKGSDVYDRSLDGAPLFVNPLILEEGLRDLIIEKEI